MAETPKAERVCHACGSMNDQDTQRCAACGADLQVEEEPARTQFIDDDPALRYVDMLNRTELDRFERLDQAELACGMLRANGIACELSSMLIPGLPAEVILWVHTYDAELAWALLADAEREASTKNNEEA
jgi:hypothetical protein